MKALPTFILLLVSQVLFAQNLSEKILDNLLIQFLEESDLPGVSVCVNRDGNLVYSKGFGYADLENKVNMTASTQIRAASVSKMITVTALAKLVSDGKLDLDSPISQYIEGLSSSLQNLTTRQIASHTAGLPHQPKSERSKRGDFVSSQELIDLVEETELLFEPGTDYKYSTLGYNLLAGVIEGASGKTYLDYLQNDIFIPLEMNQTFPDDEDELSQADAKMYFFKKEKLVLDKQYFKGNYKLPGAGFKSTSQDLAKMMDAYTNGMISTEAQRDVLKEVLLSNGKATGVSLGWRLNTDLSGRRTIEHAGNWQGARTVIVHFPEEKLTISIMINAQCTVFIEEMAQMIGQLFLNNLVQNESLVKIRGPVSGNKTSDNSIKINGEILLSEEGNGRLSLDSEYQFLNESPILYLGFEDNYALITEFGPLFLKLSNGQKPFGEIFLFQAFDREKPSFIEFHLK